jgi:hypothetical protein
MKIKILTLLFILTSYNITTAQVQTNESFHDGDDYLYFKTISDYLKQKPVSPYSSFYFNEILSMDYIKPIGWYENFSKNYISNLSSINSRESNNLALQAKIIFQNFQYTRKLTDENPLVKEGYYINRWTMYDPFTEFGNYDFLQPDIINKSKKTYSRVIKITDNYGSINTINYISQKSGIINAESSIFAPTPIKLRIYSNGEYRCFINNREAVVNSYQQTKQNLRIIQTSTPGNITINIILKNTKNLYFSVLTTDIDDNLIDCTDIPNNQQQNIEANEVYDYPLSSKQIQEDRKLQALSYDMLNSNKSISIYKKYIEQNNDLQMNFRFADELINLRSNKRWLQTEGWKQIHNIRNSNARFVPVRYYTAFEASKEGTYNIAEKELIPFLNSKSKWLHRMAVYIYDQSEKPDLLEKQIDRISKIFPYYYEHHYYLSQYFKNIDLKYYLNQLNLYRNFSRNKQMDLEYFKLLQNSGINNKAYTIAKQYLDFNDFSFTSSYLKQLILDHKHNEASKELLNYSVVNTNPYIQYLLGLNLYTQNQNPDLYWNKIYGSDIHDYYPHDYLNFRETKTFRINTDNTTVDPMNFFTDEYSNYTYPYILHRYKIYQNNRAHYYNHTFIKIEDDFEIRKFGEYTIPFSKPRILKARVHSKNGDYTDSLETQIVNGKTYITLHALKKDSIIEIEYETAINSVLEDTGFFISEPIFLADYDEALKSAKLTVEYPEDSDVNIYSNYLQKEASENNNSIVFDSYNVSNIPSIRNENNNGMKELHLPYYQFSEPNGLQVYIKMLAGNFDSTQADKKLPDPINQNETIHQIYSSIQNEFYDLPFTSFVPRHFEDTVYFKSGSEIDKIILCQNLLEKKGIISYPAIIKNPLTDSNRTHTRSSYYGAILHIPDNDLFLDFSSRYFSPGSISDAYVDESAVYISANTFNEIKIKEKVESKETINLSVDITNNNSFTASLAYIGNKSKIRSYFLDLQYNKNYLSQILNSLKNTMIYNTFSFSNLKNRNKSFIINVEGEIPDFTIIANDVLIIKPFVRNSELTNLTVEKHRTQDLYIFERQSTKDDISILLPEKYDNLEISYNQSFEYKNAFARFTIYKKSGTNLLISTEEINLPKMVVKPDEYPKFVEFIRSISVWEGRTISLKGNK